MDNFLLMRSFKEKNSCKTNFLNFYQVLNAIPKYLLFKARNLGEILKDVLSGKLSTIPAIKWSRAHYNLDRAKTKEF